MGQYFYVSPSGDGWRNLAVDEFFLNSLHPDDFMLYLYVNSNAVIIGRGQNPWRECNLDIMEKDSVQLVRRCSGGGAVYHDSGNLNFSFIAGKRYDLQRQMKIILDAVNSFGISAVLSGRNDITVDGLKFSGNAFCSRGENFQHHGTLLLCADLTVMQKYLNVSQDKLRSKGVASVKSRVCNLNEYAPSITVSDMSAALKSACSKRLGSLQDYSMSAENEIEVGKLYEQHRSWEWRIGNSPSFDYNLETRFDWGGVQLCINVEKGIVSDAVLYTDALNFRLPSVVSGLLSGSLFDAHHLSERLNSSPEQKELADLANFLETQQF